MPFSGPLPPKLTKPDFFQHYHFLTITTSTSWSSNWPGPLHHILLQNRTTSFMGPLITIWFTSSPSNSWTVREHLIFQQNYLLGIISVYLCHQYKKCSTLQNNRPCVVLCDILDLFHLCTPDVVFSLDMADVPGIQDGNWNKLWRRLPNLQLKIW